MPLQMSDQMNACVDACLDCYSICLSTAAGHCLEVGGTHVEKAHFTLMLACAEICRTAAHFMLLGTPHHKRICGECAEICAQCGDDCERLGDMDACVQACRACAESCREMAA